MSAWGGAGLERPAKLLDSPVNKGTRDSRTAFDVTFMPTIYFLTVSNTFSTTEEIIAATACLGLGRTRPMLPLGKMFLVKVEKLKWTIRHGENVMEARQKTFKLSCVVQGYRGQMGRLFGATAAACIGWKCVLDLDGNIVGTNL